MGVAVQRGLYGGSPFKSYKSNQEIHEETALFRGGDDPPEENYRCLSSSSPFFSHKNRSFQNCLRPSRPEVTCEVGLSHPWAPTEDLESADEGTGLLSSVLEPARTNRSCPPHLPCLRNE